VPATLRHFAVNAADVPRARRFYEDVFGWTFSAGGPPDFYQVFDAGEGVVGALQARRELVAGRPMTGLEITFGVDDLAATVAAVEGCGGRIVMAPFRIPGVGELVFLEDTEGNLVGAMQYEPGVFPD